MRQGQGGQQEERGEEIHGCVWVGAVCVSEGGAWIGGRGEGDGGRERVYIEGGAGTASRWRQRVCLADVTRRATPG